MSQYAIQINAKRDNGYAWEFYQSLNATNERAAKRCYDKWLNDITPSGRINFRMIKIFEN